MVVTPFDDVDLKTPCSMQTSWFYFIEAELLLIAVLRRRNRNFCPFCSCDLDLDPMTIMYELDLR